jgi:hypothetical protein
MSASVVTLPVTRIMRDQKGATIAVHISVRDLSRLRARAKDWQMTLDEAAAAVLSIALDPKRGR